MAADELCHFKHAHLLLAAEDALKVFISIDVTSFLSILKIILLDVVPNTLHYFRSRERAVAHDGLKGASDLHRFHKSRVWFTFSFRRRFCFRSGFCLRFWFWFS